MRNATGKLNDVRRLAAWMAVVLAVAAPLAGQTTLRQAAAVWGIPIGAAASADEYGPPDLLLNAKYANLLSTQYDMLEPGNAMKWDVTQPTQTTFNFQPGDELVAFAQANGMRVRGHNLCWHTQFPGWLQPYANNATKAQMATLLENHIDTEVTHFAGNVFAWDVVNEAFSDSTPTTLGNSIWYNQPGIGLSENGTAYIEQVFRWAHKADPRALLFYNEAEGEGLNRKSDAIYAMVKDFKRRGVPIHGVGLQMHVPNLDANVPEIAANIARLTALGLQVHITELDVSLPVDSSGRLLPDDLTRQAEVYRGIVWACLNSPRCTAIQTWGFTDKYSWIGSHSRGARGQALPFDRVYQPKPAYRAVLEELLAGRLSAH